MAKKTVRQQDFMKRKLKVGKPKQKPSNVTDTSFQMKRISLPSQTKISSGSNGKSTGNGTGVLDLNQEVIKRVSLLRHHSDVTRKETVLYFESMISRIIHLPSMNNLMQSSIPLMCDSSKQVRDELANLLDTIGKHDANVLKLQIRAITLYLNNAMTHIIAPIQRDSGMFVQVVLKYCADELVRHAWIKMLKGFFQVLGWTIVTQGNNKAKGKSISMGITSSSVLSMNKNKKHKNENLKAMLQFIRAGVLGAAAIGHEDRNPEQGNGANSVSPLLQQRYVPYMIPEFPQPYAYLKLFTRQFAKGELTSTGAETSSTDSGNMTLEELETLSCEDTHTRRMVFNQHFYPSIQRQLPALIKDGGECGRTAHSFSSTLEEILQITV